MHRVALVHDYLLLMRGAERGFAEIAACWPEAPIYTLLYDPEGTEGRFAGRTVRTSYLQRLGVGQRGFRRLLPLLPRATESLALDDCDLVISSSSAFAHGVRAPKGAPHICYCHSPFRYAWHEEGRALDEVPRLVRPLLRATLRRIRGWDVRAARAVTAYVANSAITRDRIREFYGRDAPVVHEPVDVDRFRAGTPEDFFLVVGELVAHKRTELALEAARRAQVPITVVGDGPERRRLETAYRGGAQFLGRISDPELAELYPRARAVVMPNVEEFGIVAVEAQAAGRPVVAADAGGARETVIDDETGVLLPPDDVDALADVMRSTDFDRFAPERAREQSERFSNAEFRRRFTEEVERLTRGGGARAQRP
jgi:glycosyltransferase involved in cell wall biosynthesis